MSLVTSNGTLTARVSGIADEDYSVGGSINLKDASAWESIINIEDIANATVSVTMPTTNRAGFFRVRWLKE